MKLLNFADLHANDSSLDRLENLARGCDALVCAGDFTIFGQGQRNVLKRLNSFGKPVIIVHGNHEVEELVRKDASDLENCVFLHGKGHVIKDTLFMAWGGGGFSLIDYGLLDNFDYFVNAATYHKQKGGKVVLITHAPPKNTTLDDIYGESVGNQTIRDVINSMQPDLFVSGHIHETQGNTDKLQHTVLLNPGPDGVIMHL